MSLGHRYNVWSENRRQFHFEIQTTFEIGIMGYVMYLLQESLFCGTFTLSTREIEFRACLNFKNCMKEYLPCIACCCKIASPGLVNCPFHSLGDFWKISSKVSKCTFQGEI